MHCQEAERGELAEKYLRGGLEPEAQESFELHFLECKSCQQVLEALNAAREGLSQRAEEIRALPLASGVGWVMPAVAGVAVVALVSGGLYLRHRYAKRNLAHGTPSHAVTSSVPTKAPAPAVSSPTGSVGPSAKSATGTKTVTAPPAGNRSEQAKAPSATSAQKSAPPAVNAASPPNQTGGLAGFTPGAAAKAEERSDVVEAEMRQLETFPAPRYSPQSPATGQVKPKVFEGTGTVEESTNRSGDWTRPDFQQAMFAYSDGRYWSAIALLEDDLKAEPQAADTNFYLGACYLMVGRIADAVAPMKVAAEDKKSPLRQSAHFYLAKAYIRMRQVADAQAEMQAAAALPGALKEEAASELARLKALPTP